MGRRYVTFPPASVVVLPMILPVTGLVTVTEAPVRGMSVVSTTSTKA
jgi:hypothetical protein